MFGPLHIEVPIFNTSVVVCADCDMATATDAIYRYRDCRTILPEPYSNPDDRGWVKSTGGDIYMWVRDPQNQFSVVFHELVHVAFTILEIRGMAVDEEAIAYLVGWLKIEVADKISDYIEAKGEPDGLDPTGDVFADKDGYRPATAADQVSCLRQAA